MWPPSHRRRDRRVSMVTAGTSALPRTRACARVEAFDGQGEGPGAESGLDQGAHMYQTDPGMARRTGQARRSGATEPKLSKNDKRELVSELAGHTFFSRCSG